LRMASEQQRSREGDCAACRTQTMVRAR
jgi:hypothetical protein